ncbi:MAG TPA: DNA repair exonuclease, partial [Gemmatimonadaceae bacterium]|nr:DNA repair exonuclease [Gemmatimonadaceae bacterium]
PETVPHASTADAWHRLVDLAIAHAVDAVLLSGDVVDQDNRFFEARTPLESGLHRLQTAGIRAIAVAGNHDHDVLPALVRSLPDGLLTLLGVGGCWERLTLTTRDASSRVHVLGWSFPSRTVRESPLATLPTFAPDGVPTIGLVHGDLDVPTSPYAPLARESLARAPVDAWLLGHIHAGGPRHRDGEPVILYPGSPQPLDPGETGAHGAWLLQVRAGEPLRPQFVPLASVQYDAVLVPLDGCTTLEAVRERTVEAVEAAARASLDAHDGLAHVAMRVRWCGRAPASVPLEPLVAPLRAWTGDVAVGTSAQRTPATLGITHVHDETAPAYDLARLADGHDAVAWLARLRLALEEPPAAARDTRDPDAADRAVTADALNDLRTEARRLAHESAQHAMYRDALDDTDRRDAVVDAMLRAQVDGLLETLLAQRSVAVATDGRPAAARPASTSARSEDL